MKYTLAQLKQKRNELAYRCIELQDKLYCDCDNNELMLDYEDANSEYEYVCALIAKADPVEIAWDKAFDEKYAVISDYRRSINNLKFEGIHYRTFINDDGDKVIRYNEDGDNYTEEIFNGIGKLIKIIDVRDGHTHIQGDEY